MKNERERINSKQKDGSVSLVTPEKQLLFLLGWETCNPSPWSWG